MAKSISESGTKIKNIGWLVTFAGMGVNLALGILYTWSVISKGIPADWNWSEADKSWPYAVACLMFSVMMVPAGRLQDKIGPRLVVSIGGILVALGLILSSRTTTLWGFIVGFGLFVGAGIGFGYASATPPALKWFPAAKTGLISGIVVSGFGLASVYAAPLATYLMNQFGIQAMLLILGIAFFFLVVGLAQVIKAPPAGYVPAGTAPVKSDPGAAVKKVDFTPKDMLGTLQFYMLWFMYACGAGAGLMVISKLSAIAKIQANIDLGFVLVAVLAIGNGGGRILAGMLSDKIGRKNTLLLCFVLQAILVFLLSRAIQGSVLATVPVLVVVSALIGACYGANLAVFPSVTKDFYGLKNFGANYGLVFTSWGVGGFSLSLLAGSMYDKLQSFNVAYYGASGLLILAAVMTLFLKSPHRVESGGAKGQ